MVLEKKQRRGARDFAVVFLFISHNHKNSLLPIFLIIAFRAPTNEMLGCIPSDMWTREGKEHEDKDVRSRGRHHNISFVSALKAIIKKIGSVELLPLSFT